MCFEGVKFNPVQISHANTVAGRCDWEIVKLTF